MVDCGWWMKPVAFLFLGLCVAAPHQDRGRHGKIAWELDPAAGLAKAKEQQKSALLYFTADW